MARIRECFSLLPESYDKDVAEAVARFAYEKRNVIDLIAITGDVATTGLATDLTEAYEFINAKPGANYRTPTNRPTLKSAGCEIFRLPGNHDRFHDVDGEPACRNFDLKFQAYLGAEYTTIGRVILEREASRLCIISADFCLRVASDATHPIALMKKGQGRAYRDVIEELQRITESARHEFDDVQVLWALHFPPSGSVKTPYALIEHADVQLAARESRVHYLLSGHLHKSQIEQIGDMTLFWAGSSCAVSDRNSLHLFEFEFEGSQLSQVKRIDFHWDQSACDFLEAA